MTPEQLKLVDDLLDEALTNDVMPFMIGPLTFAALRAMREEIKVLTGEAAVNSSEAATEP
jgi:hypothetical protein